MTEPEIVEREKVELENVEPLMDELTAERENRKDEILWFRIVTKLIGDRMVQRMRAQAAEERRKQRLKWRRIKKELFVK